MRRRYVTGRVVLAGCVLLVLSVRLQAGTFAGSGNVMPLSAASELRSILSHAKSCDSEPAKGTPRLVRRLVGGELDPSVLIITTPDGINDRLGSVNQNLPNDVFRIVLVVGDELEPDEELAKNSVAASFVCRRISEDTFEKFATSHHRLVEAYFGLYVFGQKGKTAWFSGDIDDATLAECRITANALKTAAFLRRKAASPTRSTSPVQATSLIPGTVRSLRAADDDRDAARPLATVLQSYGRRAILINIWATTCHPCIDEMPILAKLMNEHASVAQYVGLLTQPAEDDVRRAVREHVPPQLRGDQFVLLDRSPVSMLFPDEPGQHVADIVVPLFALIDGSNHIVLRLRGSLLGKPANLKRLQDALNALTTAPKVER
jgi:thiol-disulfide isomerase/thioredoxin